MKGGWVGRGVAVGGEWGGVGCGVVVCQAIATEWYPLFTSPFTVHSTKRNDNNTYPNL